MNLFATYVMWPNTAVKNVERLIYFDTKLNAFQRQFSRHARGVEKAGKILKTVVDAIELPTVMQHARKTTGEDTRLIVRELRGC
jgi:hypothetical protein